MNGPTNQPSHSSTDLDADLEIHQTRQLLGLPNPEADLTERLLARTLNRIEAGETTTPHRPAPSRVRRSKLTYWAVAAGIVVLAVAGASLWPPAPAMAAPPTLTYPHDVTQPALAPAASDVFAQLAQASAKDSDDVQGSVQYIATTGWVTMTDAMDASTSIVPKQRQWWVAPDGSALAIEHTSPLLDDDGTLSANTDTRVPATTTDRFPAGTVPPVPGDFPSDPALLRAALNDACEDATDVGACLLTRVGELATTHLLTSRFTEALWLALEPVATIHDLGLTTDRTGRTVVALAAGPHPTMVGTSIVVLLVDPATGTPVGTEEITLTSETLPIEAPTVTAFTTITNAHWVDETGATPQS